MWLRVETVSQKMKQNAQTQDAYSMQAFLCVLYDGVRTYISTKIRLKGREGSGAPSPSPPRFC